MGNLLLVTSPHTRVPRATESLRQIIYGTVQKKAGGLGNGERFRGSPRPASCPIHVLRGLIF
jgi:hypothetical protein